MAVESQEPAGLVRRLVAEGRGAAALRLAAAAFKAGQHRQAEAMAQAALDSGLHDPHAYYLLAAAAAVAGRPAVAADMARVGIALDPEPDAARRDLAAVLLDLGRPAEAAAALEAIPPARRCRMARERLALAYALSGQRGRARVAFRDLLRDHPDDGRARAALARLAPRPAGPVLDAVAATLEGPMAILFARLRRGPATEADLAAELAAAGYPRVLIKALVRDLAERTRPGAVPLVRLDGEVAALDLAILDIDRTALPEGESP